MFQIATYLPPFSNREDYLLTLSLFDDDTTLPISLSGITLANNGANFTAAAWTVSDGAIATTSATSITIPTFPITQSNNLTALPLTVGAGLAIKAGDPIQIADTATNTNILNGFVTSYNINTGALIVQIGWTFQFEIRRGGPRNSGSGYITWWDWGTPDDLGALLQASFGNGFLSLIDVNVIQILIPEATVKTLGSIGPFNSTQADSPGTFRASMTGTDGVNTRQFLTGSQPIYDGGVTN
jgi:hypothetical protein